MPTRRVLKGALTSFLGTYTSRNTTFRGFWLLGFLVAKFDWIEIDLLSEDSSADDILALKRAKFLAVKKFAKQLEQFDLNRAMVQSAGLVIERKPDDNTLFGRHYLNGFNLHFTASATADTGRRFERKVAVFVAPHDSSKELCSMERD